MIETVRAMRSISRCSGDFSSETPAVSEKMRPNSVLQAGGEHDRPAGARGHARAHEDEVRHVDGGQVLLEDGVGRLAHRVGLAGEGDVDGRHLVLADERARRR